jgi:hypothetical protein
VVADERDGVEIMNGYILRRAEGNKGPFRSVSMFVVLGEFRSTKGREERFVKERRAPPPPERNLGTSAGVQVCVYQYPDNM